MAHKRNIKALELAVKIIEKTPKVKEDDKDNKQGK